MKIGCSLDPFTDTEEANVVIAEVCQTDDFVHTIQAWEILEQRRRERIVSRHVIHAFGCLSLHDPHRPGKKLTTQQHLFPDFAQMRAHILTFVNSRTRGLVPEMMGTLDDEESNHYFASSDESEECDDRELYRKQRQRRKDG